MSSIFGLVSEKALDHPEHAALIHRDVRTTYNDLTKEVQKIADILRQKGIRNGEYVPVIFSRCAEVLFAFLAIMEVGACYIPIDKGWPRERIQATLDTIYHHTLISCTDGFNYGDYEIMSLGNYQICSKYRETDTESRQRAFEAQEKMKLAYMIFTSGTTGVPKGVMVLESSLHHYVVQGDSSAPFNLGVAPGDVVLLMLSVAFDAFTAISMSTLSNGGSLLLSDPSSFLEDAESCTILPTTPSLLKTLPMSSSFKQIRKVFLGGEPPDSDLVKLWSRDGRRLFNSYGATETTCTSLMTELVPEKPITLGQPIPGSEVFLLNADLADCDEGQLAISGIGLAKGYYQDPKTTAEKFISCRGKRMYLTGDFAKRTQDGIFFLGRKDSMVKVRDHFVNLETEIIPILKSCSNVTDAVAFVHLGLLVAFVTPDLLDPIQIRSQLQKLHPSYYVPDRITALETLPISSNGKVDVGVLRKTLMLQKNDSPQPQSSSKEHIMRHCVSEALHVHTKDIDLDQSFWELGGNSLSAMRLMSCLQVNGLVVRFEDIFRLSTLWQLILSAEEVVYEFMTQQLHSYPASTQQLQMIRSSIRRKDAGLILVRMTMNEKTSTAPFPIENAWRTILARHSAFKSKINVRTGMVETIADLVMHSSFTFINDQDIEVQIARDSINMIRSYEHIDEADCAIPQMKLNIIVIPNEKVHLLWLVHHSLLDGWSVAIIIEELGSFLQDTPLPPAPHLSYLGPIIQRASGRRKLAGTEFWERELRNFTSITELRIPPKPIVDTREMFPLSLARNLAVSSQDLSRISRQNKVSEATIFYASWAVVLSEFISDPRVTFAVIFSGRSLAVPDIDRYVGPLVNTCPFALIVPSKGCKNDFLQGVQDRMLKLHVHQWATNEILGDSATNQFSQLFNTVVAVELGLPDSAYPQSLNDVEVTVSRTEFPEFPLTVFIEKGLSGLRCRFVLDQDADSRFASRLLDAYVRVIDAITSEKESDISNVRKCVVDAPARDKLHGAADSHNQCSTSFESVVHAFDVCMQRFTHLEAIRAQNGSFTYAQLKAEVDRIARFLSASFTQGSCVAVLSDGSAEWAFSAIAVMASGMVYMPIDCRLPQQQMECMFAIGRARVCILPNKDCEHIIRPWPFATMNLQQLNDTCAGTWHAPNISPQDNAYVIFTSGSTGNPKAVTIKHGPLISYLMFQHDRLEIQPGCRLAQMFSVGFDVSIAELFGTLCFGATLILKNNSDPVSHLSQATCVMATPSLLATISPLEYPNLSTVFLAGETVSQSLADRWSSKVRLFNGYGPCECTIISSIAELKPRKRVTIGQPIPGTNIYVLNSELQKLPIGVVGQICISGPHVAAAYLDDDLETSTKFVEDPFRPRCTMYCTGDLGAWTEYEELEFHGRQDFQVKVRGYRIELGQVESAISSLSPPNTQIAIFWEQDQLIAVACPIFDASGIKRQLTKILPSYAIPAKFFVVESFPTTPNSKLDRNAVLEMTKDLEFQQLTIKPRGDICTTTGEAVAKAFKMVLKLPPDVMIGPEDNFLDLGGNSLRQIRLAQTLSQLFGRSIPLRLVIQNPVLGDLESAIDIQTQESNTGPCFFLKDSKEAAGNDVLSFQEEDIFKSYCASAMPSAFNVVTKLQLVGDVDLDRLKYAVDAVLDEHEIFRCVYRMNTTQPMRQAYLSAPKATLYPVWGKTIEEVDRDLVRPIDLSTRHPLEVYLLDETWRSWIMIKMHHIICDKTSIKVFLDAISQRYAGEENAYSNRSYAAWAIWQRSKTPQTPHGDVTFWRNLLESVPRPPFSRLNKPFAPTKGSPVSFIIPVGKKTRQSLETCVASVYLAVSAETSHDDIVIGIPHMDRSEHGTEEMIGVFLDCVPIRINAPQARKTPAVKLVDDVRNKISASITHSMPLSTIRRECQCEQLLDVVVAYHAKEDAVSSHLKLPNTNVAGIEFRMDCARFPLLADFHETEEGLRCSLECCPTLVSLAQADSLRKSIMRFLGE